MGYIISNTHFQEIGGEEDIILFYHMYSLTNEQVYFNHKEEKRQKDRKKY